MYTQCIQNVFNYNLEVIWYRTLLKKVRNRHVNHQITLKLQKSGTDLINFRKILFNNLILLQIMFEHSGIFLEAIVEIQQLIDHELQNFFWPTKCITMNGSFSITIRKYINNLTIKMIQAKKRDFHHMETILNTPRAALQLFFPFLLSSFHILHWFDFFYLLNGIVTNRIWNTTLQNVSHVFRYRLLFSRRFCPYLSLIYLLAALLTNCFEYHLQCC